MALLDVFGSAWIQVSSAQCEAQHVLRSFRRLERGSKDEDGTLSKGNRRNDHPFHAGFGSEMASLSKQGIDRLARGGPVVLELWMGHGGTMVTKEEVPVQVNSDLSSKP